MESTVQVATTPLQEARILGVRVHALRMTDALHQIEQFIAQRTPHLVITADANAILLALQNPEFHALMEQAALITADGFGLLWAGKRLGHPFPERVSGVDLVEQLVCLSHEKGYRLYFVGASPGVAQRAAEQLLRRYPNAQIVGVQHGYFTREEEPAVVAQIAAAHPDVVLIGMGMPRQELWAWRYKDALGAPVLIGVGGSFDVYGGVVKRAPRWLQRIGGEWLWRLLQDPRKIKKVRNLPRFAWLVLRAKRTHRA